MAGASELCKLGQACLNGEQNLNYPGSTFFIDPAAMSPLQLLWCFASYGYVLFVSANMIGDGAELLLLIPKYKDLVASVVLPILGAVPDGMMVLFSGVGPLAVAQENVAVGVGALAGSTIMLLTLPWILSFYGGKVDFDAAGKPAYDKKKSQRDTNGFPAMIFSSGIMFESGAKDNAKIMMVTSMAYFCIQIPAFLVDDQKTKDEYASDKAYIQEVKIESGGVHTASLIGIVVTVLLLAFYLYLQVKAAMSSKADEKKSPEAGATVGMDYLGVMGLRAAPSKVMKDGWLEEKGMRMHIQYLRDRAKEEHGEADKDVTVAYAQFHESFLKKNKTPLSADMTQELTAIYKKYARKSKNVRGIGMKDMQEALAQIGLNYAEEKFRLMFKKADENNSGDLQLEEFLDFFCQFIIFSKDPLPWEEEGGDDDDDDEMPDEFKTLGPEEQQKKILQSSVQQMLFGTILVLIFSDPMVDVLSEIGKMTGVPAFYVSFVLAPLASNASELVASFKLATKKSSESITQSLQTLEGAAIMNNTFCLGIFYVLIYYQGLAWKFTAETISIVFVQILVGVLVLMKSTQSMLFGLIVFSLYPLSLFLVAFLEANGLD